MPDASHGSPALPVAVIGAGPVGLAAAAHLLARGMAPVVLEAGAAAGAAIRAWGHVRMFSPWRFNVDAAARAALERHGWVAPEPEGYPTGTELVARYLEPLAALPGMGVRYGARVVGVTRRGHDLMRDADRALAPFVVQVERGGVVGEIAARAVLDCSGTWGRPNPAGAHGLAVPGEAAAPVAYGIPDVLGHERAAYAGRSVLVVGSGHSAMNVALDLAARPEGGEVLWAFRRAVSAATFGGGEADGLAERGALGARARALADTGKVRMLAPFAVAAMAKLPDGRVRVVAEDGRAAVVERVIVAAGFRPDLSFLSELRLGLDPAVQCTPALAPLIDPNIHSCGTVRPHGEAELRHPETDFWIAGMKSYGRAPTFLMTTGHEQVRSIVAALAGDWAAAREVRLELPETGVCSGAPGAAGAGAACCAPAPAVVDAGSTCCAPAANVAKCCGA